MEKSELSFCKGGSWEVHHAPSPSSRRTWTTQTEVYKFVKKVYMKLGGNGSGVEGGLRDEYDQSTLYEILKELIKYLLK